MTERRFSEDEAAEIFARAAEAEQPGRPPTAPREGMTLAQLQDIGQEVGIAPELVARAARSVALAPRPPRRFLGLPIGVGRTVDLGRRLSDEDWERLVIDLRETFDARGTVRTDGSLRQWTNGNLQALLEPTATGHRLRLKTTNGAAAVWMRTGLMMSGFSALLAGVALIGSQAAGRLTGAGFLAVVGVGMFVAGALRLPGWAKRRQQQMDALADRHAIDP